MQRLTQIWKKCDLLLKFRSHLSGERHLATIVEGAAYILILSYEKLLKLAIFCSIDSSQKEAIISISPLSAAMSTGAV